MNKEEISKEVVDCLFIGHYELTCEKYIQYVDLGAIKSGNKMEFDLNFLYYNNKPYYASDLLNFFSKKIITGNSKLFDYWGGVSLTIAYLGTYLKQRGFTFDYVNSFQKDKMELAKKLERGNIRVIAITTTYYVSYIPIIEIVKFIKTYNRSAIIIVGGPFIFNQLSHQDSEDRLDGLFDIIGADIYIQNSKGEATLINTLEALKNQQPLERLTNIHYKKGNRFISTSVSSENIKLSENLVDWSLFADAEPEYVNVRSSLSCPFNCAFCGFSKRAGKYQSLNVPQIEKELNVLNTIKSIKTVHFIDDTLNAPAQRFKRLLKVMIKNNYQFKWVSFLRCHNVDKEMVELMKKSGCIGVCVGFESGNNQILKNMNKQITVEKYYKSVKLLKNEGILINGSFILGFPGETESTVLDTRRFIEETRIDFYNIKHWFMEPQSPIMKEKEKYGIKGYMHDWSHNTMNSTQAGEIIQMLLEINGSIHLPEHQFSFQSIMHLISKGMKPETLKSFLTNFNKGVKDKINGISKNITPGIYRALKNDSMIAILECNGADECNSQNIRGQENGSVHSYKGEKNSLNAEFEL